MGDDQGAALLIAVKYRDNYLVKKLLELGADPKKTDANGMTPLEWLQESYLPDPELITILEEAESMAGTHL